MSDVFLSISHDSLTGKLQVSIDDDHGGYRLIGPKFCGMSKYLVRHKLDEFDVAEIRSYLKKVKKGKS
jgi:hypothetical protein